VLLDIVRLESQLVLRLLDADLALVVEQVAHVARLLVDNQVVIVVDGLHVGGHIGAHEPGVARVHPQLVVHLLGLLVLVQELGQLIAVLVLFDN